MDKLECVLLFVVSYLVLVCIVGFINLGSGPTEFCQENGFDYYEYYDGSFYCWKTDQDILFFKRAKCTSNVISFLAFGPSNTGCFFSKEIQELNS